MCSDGDLWLLAFWSNPIVFILWTVFSLQTRNFSCNTAHTTISLPNKDSFRQSLTLGTKKYLFSLHGLLTVTVPNEKCKSIRVRFNNCDVNQLNIYFTVLWRSVTIWINLLEFVKLCSKWCNYANQSVQGGLGDVVLNAMSLCEPWRGLYDTKTLCFTNDLWRKTFRRTNAHRSFTEPWKHLLCTLYSSSNNARFE